jgi:vancomycin permeability regulator SanA
MCFNFFAYSPVLSGIALLLMLDTVYVLLTDRCRNIGAYLPLVMAGMLMIAIYTRALTMYWVSVLVSAVLVLWCVVFCVCCILIMTVKRDDHKKAAKHLIVLGAPLRDGKLSRTLMKRLDAAAVCMRDRAEITAAILCGGKTTQHTVSESHAMRDYLVQQGIDAERLITEPFSHNTQESFAQLRKLLPDTQEIIVITSDFHVRRVRWIARDYGFVARGNGIPSAKDILFNHLLRETCSIIKYGIGRFLRGGSKGHQHRAD